VIGKLILEIRIQGKYSDEDADDRGFGHVCRRVDFADGRFVFR
jgi:hypothetical protein